VLIQKTISGEQPIYQRPTLISILPEVLDGKRATYETHEQIVQGIRESTAIGERRKNDYIRIMSASNLYGKKIKIPALNIEVGIR
jgi:hypothetical protein